MNVNGRLDRIEKQIVAYASEGVPAEVMEKAARMFEPSDDDWMAAVASILETMPERYQQLVIADADRLAALNLSACDWDRLDHYDMEPINRTGKPHPAGLTQRVVELAELRLYECPRPLILPEAFCRAFTELDPAHHLSFGDHCEKCLLEHPVLYYHEDRRIAYRGLFDQCVLCNSAVKWLGVSHYSRPCHLSKGSPYSVAMAQYQPSGGDVGQTNDDLTGGNFNGR